MSGGMVNDYARALLFVVLLARAVYLHLNLRRVQTREAAQIRSRARRWGTIAILGILTRVLTLAGASPVLISTCSSIITLGIVLLGLEQMQGRRTR